MFRKIDGFIARLFLPLQIKFDLRIAGKKFKGKPSDLGRYIYNNRIKVYRRYGITLEEITAKVEKKKMGDLEFLSDEAHRIVLWRVRGAINKSYKQGRLVFLEDGMVKYTTKDGKSQVLSLDNASSLAWDILSREMAQVSGSSMASLSSAGILPNDIKSILMELKQKGGKG